ncbi:hypothetical protein NXS19_010404 [Fusarium pseudograminearum]|uniref:Uncharacterized protein n=1 Tax=Fusarium pseudograminearum (strain CS3096) TaxID=1028729 RepID=K3VYN5_FUSPC|nr:hypothetical protein FPSE_08819 [Fusarium pseudograminearum CS3096]EKJ70960.1 hypothetical protein FPSE_08819 [Fusarium pseudograminearum CS3096]KAF0642794.1 hypothetical protein FPSE5266_08819 [Fusarium pseudograminearum]UZP42588.1 hypothetical protein NXS19_010404 [Fusarium pseudograminearum]
MDIAIDNTATVQVIRQQLESNIKVLYPYETGIMVAFCRRDGGLYEASLIKLEGTRTAVLHRSDEYGEMEEALRELLEHTMTELHLKIRVDNPDLAYY